MSVHLTVLNPSRSLIIIQWKFPIEKDKKIDMAVTTMDE